MTVRERPILLDAREIALDLPDMNAPRGLSRRPQVRVLEPTSFSIRRGEIVGIVGESGSGKSSLGRCLLRLYEPTAGRLNFDGIDITHASEDALRPLRARMQMIFQDPQSSLNPRRRIRDIVGAGLDPSAGDIRGAVDAAAVAVGLDAALLDRFPHQLSGGQRQRVGIARAIVRRPDFVLADEIVSGLDVSTQAQILVLLKRLAAEFELALAFISHDLSVIRALCDRVCVMRAGRIVEEAACAELFASPQTAYTRELLNSIPPLRPDPLWLDRSDDAWAARRSPNPVSTNQLSS